MPQSPFPQWERSRSQEWRIPERFIMAVTVITAWADTTEQAVYAGACSLKAIIVLANKAQSAAAYLQLFDAAVGAGITPGTTEPAWAFKIDTQALSGKTLHKFIFPNGGAKFNTACTAFLADAAGGGTAPLTTVLPDYIEFHWEYGV